jgi:hypothetical protein
VNDITQLDGWVISAHGYFTENSDLFPVKIKNNLNRCPMKAVVKNGHNYFTTIYDSYIDSNGTNRSFVQGLEFDLLKFLLRKLNRTIDLVPIPKGFEFQEVYVNNLINAMYAKEADIALGTFGTNFFVNTIFRLNQFLLHEYYPLVCTVFCQISKME